MKKIFFVCLASIFAVFVFNSVSCAQEVMTVSGNDYSVITFCLDDAGDFCNRNDINQDTFQFQDNGDFTINSLEDQKELIDTSDGSYNANAIGFNGDYTITIDFRLKKYEFSFLGLSIADALILGQFNVTYFEFGGFPPDYDQKGQSQAYFLGFRQ